MEETAAKAATAIAERGRWREAIVLPLAVFRF
jgi:hypothetical protein